MASAAMKGTWEVKKGTTGAILLVYNPRVRRISNDALGKLAEITLLRDVHLVTKVFYCPAFSMYLSDKSEWAIPSPDRTNVYSFMCRW